MEKFPARRPISPPARLLRSPSSRSIRRLRIAVLALAASLPAAAGAQEPAAAAPAAPLARAEAALAAGEAARAEVLLREVLDQHPALPRAHLGLARALAAQGRQREAVAVLVRAGEGLLGAGRPAEAAELLATGAELAPGSGTLRALLGRARMRERSFEAAHEALARAVELGADDRRTRLYLAASLWETGRVEAAEAAYRDLAAEPGAGALPLHQLGRLLAWQGRFAEAVPWLERVAALAPRAPDVALDLAQALAGAEQPEAALTAYDRFLALAPEHMQGRYGRARLLARLGRHDEATAELEIYRRLYRAGQEATRESGLAEAALARGRDLLARGEPGAAAEHLATLPASPETSALLGRALIAAGRAPEAVAVLERAVAADPERRDLRALLDEARLAAAEDAGGEGTAEPGNGGGHGGTRR